MSVEIVESSGGDYRTSGNVEAQSETSQFLHEAEVVRAPVEIYALWLHTMRAQMPKDVRQQLEQDERDALERDLRLGADWISSQFSEQGIIMPTCESFGAQIPETSPDGQLTIMNLPDVAPVFFVKVQYPSQLYAKNSNETPLRLNEDTNVVYSLVLDMAGKRLLAFSSDPPDWRVFLPPQDVRELLHDTKGMKRFAKDFVQLLNEASFVRPSIGEIPGAQYTTHKTDSEGLPRGGGYLLDESLRRVSPRNKRFSGDLLSCLSQMGIVCAPIQEKTQQQQAIEVVHTDTPESIISEASSFARTARKLGYTALADWLIDTYEYGVTNVVYQTPAVPRSFFKDMLAPCKQQINKESAKKGVVLEFIKHACELINKAGLHDPPRYGASVYERPFDELFPLEKPGQDQSSLDTDRRFHSFDDKPAVMLCDGTRQWFKHGVLHRDIGPAEFLPRHTRRNPSDHNIYVFWTEGELKNPTLDHPSVWSTSGDRFWGTDPERPRREKHNKPSSVYGKQLEFWTGNGFAYRHAGLPESRDAFTTDLRGRESFVDITAQEYIDRFRWNTDPEWAHEHALKFNKLEDRSRPGDNLAKFVLHYM